MKATVDRFEDLVAWQKARALVKSVYTATSNERFARDFALTNQIRKAAISMPSNIAEGFERGRIREFHQFVSIAKGSCAEVRAQLYLAADLGYLSPDQLRDTMQQAIEVGRILGGLRASLEAKLLSTQHSVLRT